MPIPVKKEKNEPDWNALRKLKAEGKSEADVRKMAADFSKKSRSGLSAIDRRRGMKKDTGASNIGEAVSNLNKNKGNPNYKSKASKAKFAGTGVLRSLGDAFSANNPKSLPQRLAKLDEGGKGKGSSASEKKKKARSDAAVQRRLEERRRMVSQSK